MSETGNCVYAVACCDPDEGPAVSADCGITDRVTRLWSQTSYGNHADPWTDARPVFVGRCCEEAEGESERSCR